MTEDDRYDFILKLDEELLLGSVLLSEWSCFIVQEADTAFVNGAHLACILTSVAAIETHLRFESSAHSSEKFFNLIENAGLSIDLKDDLHTLRKYRNKWVHISDPSDDQELINNPDHFEKELEDMALFSIRVLRRALYSNQGT